jgi:hypothetical protein
MPQAFAPLRHQDAGVRLIRSQSLYEAAALPLSMIYALAAAKIGQTGKADQPLIGRTSSSTMSSSSWPVYGQVSNS